MTNRVLVVEDDAPVREALAQTLDLADLVPITAGSFIVAKDHITPDFPGIVLSDIRMPGRDGFHLLQHARNIDDELPVILLTGEGDIPMAVRAMSQGAFDFLEKPCAPKTLLAVVQRALKLRTLVLENRALRVRMNEGDAAARMIFGVSKAAEELRSAVRQVAETIADVLVLGEPGTGTSKIAEVVHLLSAGSRAAFEKRAAAGLRPAALDAAFTEAQGGSLFIDEIATLPPETQMALQERLERPRDVRLIAGTYKDLGAEVLRGHFSQDLHLKLEAVRVRIPALRERPEDIPVLFRHYVALASEQAALDPPHISSEQLGRLMTQDWPGNARALMNAAMRFSLGLGTEGSDGETGDSLAARMSRVERSFLTEALKLSGGRASEAARRLDLPRKTFYDKLARHGVKPEDFRS